MIILFTIWHLLPFSMLIILAGLQGVPDEIIEAAEIDGATSLKSHLFVIVPTIRGVLFFVTLISIMDVLRTFDQLIPLAPQAVEIGNESIMLYIYNIAFREGSERLGLGSAISVLTILLILIMLTPVHPRHVQGSEGGPMTSTQTQTPVAQPKGSRRLSRAPAARPRRRGFWMVAGLFLLRHLRAVAEPLHLDRDVGDQADQRGVRQPAGASSTARRLQAFVDLWQTTYFARVPGQHPDRGGHHHRDRPADRHSRRRTRCPGCRGYISAVLLILALIFRALPRFAVVLPMYEISRALGIYDTTYALAIALVAINQPFSIWLLRNFFAEIPRSLDEAAMIDGCTRISMLRKVMIPLMGPGILTAGIFLFLFAFQEYLTAAILTDTASKTVPVFITTQLGQTLPMLQQAGAAAILLTLPVIGIAFIAQKYLVAGLASGAVKG